MFTNWIPPRCGKRGGYYELVGFDQPTKDVIYKIASISLCSNVTGQIIVGLNSNPPKQGDPSFSEYETQKNTIIQSLERRSQKLVNLLNTLEGVSCNSADGAMYAFPNITIPPKAIEAAKQAGRVPDMFYCLELLANTGICVVPGSGFGQREGTFHFRTTFLPKEENIDEVNTRLSTFHKSFMDQYR
jgi:alanine transaminase